MEAGRRGLRAGTRTGTGTGGSALLVAVLAVLAVCGAAAEAEDPRAARQRGDEQCHYYAGGQVYPGEAARLPVTDHSLHLSQAKSRCGAGGRRRRRKRGCTEPIAAVGGGGAATSG